MSLQSDFIYQRYACLSINTTGKKLDFNTTEEISVFRIAFDVFYDAVVGSSSRVPGQYTKFGKKFVVFMVSIGLADLVL